ncbi:hypothetical protein ACWEOE_00060 [Amycolatopsis sp. NPDC004368]
MDDQVLDGVAELAVVLKPHESGAAAFRWAHHERLVRASTWIEQRRVLRSWLGLFRGAAGSFDDLETRPR